MYVTGEIAEAVIMETPMIESFDMDSDIPEGLGGNVVMQISACIRLFDVNIGDSETSYQERLEDEFQQFACVPLVDRDIKVQRLIAGSS